MTEEEWLAERWPLWMVFDPICRSPRKRRLFVVACIRRFPELLKAKKVKEAIAWAEDFVDQVPRGAVKPALTRGANPGRHRDSAYELSAHIVKGLLQEKFGNYIQTIDTLCRSVGNWESRQTDDAIAYEREYQKELVFEIFGNPFHLITPSTNLFTWNDGAIPQIAAAIYEERRFEDISILADALENAGSEPALVEHCRNGQPHVRGCWVIDLLLGKK